MFDIILPEEYKTSTEGTSEGTQTKYFKDNIWYKEDSIGGEAACEYLATLFLDCTDLPYDSYVRYEIGRINNQTGCKSESFLQEGEEFITLYRFYQTVEGRKLNLEINKKPVQEQIEFILSYFQKMCDLDLTEYLSNILAIDRIILNEDRHFNNLGIIRTENDIYRPAPIFDNGRSFFVGNFSVRQSFSLEKNVLIPSLKPFSGGRNIVQELLPCNFCIDYSRCEQMIFDLKDDEAYQRTKVLWGGFSPEEILLYQLNEASRYIPAFSKEQEYIKE